MRARSSLSALTVLGLLAMSTTVAAASQPRLGIKGYDPVAYFTMSRPVAGKPELEHTFDEVRYRFATPEHLALFQADPERYAPRFRGLCAMGLGAKGYKVEANPENWVIHEGRLYLTQRDFGPPAFRRNPERWRAAAKAHLEKLEALPIGSALSWW